MKRAIIIAVMLGLVVCSPVFAGNSNGNGSNQNGSTHHNYNTTNKGGNSEANAGAVGVGVGISKNKNTNKNTVVGVNKNLNANFNANDIKNKIKNDVKVKNDVDVDTTDVNVNLLKNNQGQAQSANNRQAQAQDASNKQGQATDVTLTDNSVSEDNSVYMAPPSTTPLAGTASAQITTPFGGVGFSKDAQYSIYKYKMDVTEESFARGYITEEERIKMGAYLYKKFIRANKKGVLAHIVDPLF